MPTTDRREPAVYVSIEDASYAAPAIEMGRVGYIATVCDRGPHNRVVTVTSRQDFHRIFGKPNFRRTSQAHYLADKFLQYSNKLLLVRVMPEDADWANSKIFAPATSAIVNKLDGITPAKFTFYPTTYSVWQKDHVYTVGDFVLTSDNLSGYCFELTTAGGGGISGSTEPIWDTTINSVTTDRSLVWTCRASGFNIVDCSDDESLYVVNVGDWIFAVTDTLVGDAAQVISKSEDDNTLTLDRNYSGDESTETSIYRCAPYIAESISGVNSLADMDATSESTVYYFYAAGAGTYYNNIKIRGVRNVATEKMFTDANGDVLYPYLFMDIGVFYVNPDLTETLLEGPWTVSLTNRTPNGDIIRDLTTGNVMYLPDVINNNSSYIGVIPAAGVNNLITANNAETRRLQVMLLLSNTGSTVSTTNNVAAGGITFADGTDGTVSPTGVSPTVSMYNSQGNLVLGSEAGKLWGLIGQAYDGSLTSIDGSIEQIPECVYP